MPQEPTFFEFYDEHLRSSFFTGFLTVATFLFAVKMHIIFKLKDELYDTPSYLERFQESRSLGGSASGYYGPLRNFGRLLLGSIVLAFVAAAWQLAVVWIRTNWSAVVGVVFGCLTLLALGICIINLAGNLHDWFKHVEAEKGGAADGDADDDETVERDE
ncbi:MAG: hypothetical protein KDE27_06440 [Planctomycetes bacterium]|nr:hypothetical protein [Planctomycetota bacterium]